MKIKYRKNLGKLNFIGRFFLNSNAIEKNGAGSLNLFGRTFKYQLGKAFYRTYKELFEKKIYDFDATSNSPLIIDCGANIGLSLLFFSKRYPTARIIAFEPDVTILPYLRANIASQLLDNVVLHEKAVWTEETTLEFFTDAGMGGRIGENI